MESFLLSLLVLYPFIERQNNDGLLFYWATCPNLPSVKMFTSFICPQEKRTVPSGDLFDDLQRYTFVRQFSPPAYEPRDISLGFWDTCVGA